LAQGISTQVISNTWFCEFDINDDIQRNKTSEIYVSGEKDSRSVDFQATKAQ